MDRLARIQAYGLQPWAFVVFAINLGLNCTSPIMSLPAHSANFFRSENFAQPRRSAIFCRGFGHLAMGCLANGTL
jgi:hypothetical protein